jgi:hypothetical protein
MAERMAYIGRARCGCVPALTIDEPEYAEDVANDIAGWLRQGRTIERVTVEKGKAMLTTDCPHTPQWGRET